MLLIACTAFVSCKKDKDEAATIVGFWKGKYGTPNTYPTYGYAFLFRADGTVRVFNSADTTAAQKAEGTYTVTNAVVNTTYTYQGGGNLKYSTTATVDPRFTFMEGTYGSNANTTGGGQFFINKQ
jgi:hypothetical protein